MKELFALAYFDKGSGEFIEYVRKGRTHSIVGYDNLTSAKRGHTHSKKSHLAQKYDLRIVKSGGITIVEESD